MRGLSVFGWFAALVIGAVVLLPASSAQAWGTGAAANFTCVSGKVTASFTWTGNSPAAYVQAVHLSYTDNGWQPGTYTSSYGLSPSTNTMSWDGLNPGTRHFMRFVEWYSDGSWDSSLTFTFDTPWCGADGNTPTFLSITPTTDGALNPGFTTGTASSKTGG